MDEHKQKPTDEMLAEARRLAFFADEVFSQDIMNSYEKTESYIKRHTKMLIEQGAIKPVVKYYAYASEDIKKVHNQNTSKIFLFFNSNIFLSLLALLISYLFYLTVSSYLSDLYKYYQCESVFSLGSNIKECSERFLGLSIENAREYSERFLGLSIEDAREYSEKFKIAANGLTILKGAVVFVFIFIFIFIHFILNKLKEGVKK